jgi:aminopeptidase N
LLGLLLGFTSNYTFAQTHDHSGFSASDSLRGYLSDNRKSFDIKYYGINISVDTNEKSINGFVQIAFEVIKEIEFLQLDLFKNMSIDSITYEGGESLSHTRELNTFYVNFQEPLTAGTFKSITVHYSGKPRTARLAPWDGGFVWTTDKNGELWVATAVQGLGASSWYPCKDHQSDKPDSVSITVSVPKGFQNISNGRLRNISENDTSSTFTWFVSYPINTYNVCLNIGKFELFSDEYINADGEVLTLDYYVKDYHVQKAEAQFLQVIPMLQCFEEKFGKYPFYNDGYKIVETPYAGMEHQSAIAYGNNFENGYYGRSRSQYGLMFDYILIHESAHEWWGNNITSNDIADMWIHEGFGTYTEAVYVECLFGFEAAITYINDHKPEVQNSKPILGEVGFNNRGSVDMYRKGMLMFNTLRNVINDDELWWDILKGLNETFRHSSIDGTEVIEFINQKTGQDYSKFFKQYLAYPNLPDLEIELVQNNSDTVVKFKWVADVTGFSMPVNLIIGDTSKRIFPGEVQQEIILINTNKDDIRVDTDRSYIKVNGEIL